MNKSKFFLGAYGVLWVMIVLCGVVFSCTSAPKEGATIVVEGKVYESLSFELVDFYQTMKTDVGFIQLYVWTSMKLDAFLRMALYQNGNNPIAMNTFKKYKKELEESDACILSIVKIFMQRIKESALLDQQKQELLEAFQEIVDLMEYENNNKEDSDGMGR